MAQFDIRKWRRQLHESTLGDKRMTEAEKRETLEAVSRFNEYGKHIYKTQEIAEMVESIKKLSENASKMVQENSDDWFDSVSIKRDTKAIGEAVKVFEATAKEAQTLQQRFESVFEDIGNKLGKYYEIKELVEDEKLDPVGKEDDDVDNDGDSDAEDKYLKKKRAAITKAVKNENKFQKQVNEAFEGLQNVVTGKRTVKEDTITEGFATWKMQFAPMTLSGVKLDPKKTFTVKARSTVEAIKKASKMAGLSGNDWMATQTHKLEKVG
jgi:hypothetical protein